MRLPVHQHLLPAAALLFSAGASHAQTWSINLGQIDARSESFAVADGGLPCSVVSDRSSTGAGPVPLMPGYRGAQLGEFVETGCGFLIATCPLRTHGYAHVLVDGIGSNILTVRWTAWSASFHKCKDRNTYAAWTDIAPFLATLDLDVAGVPAGTVLPVAYRWTNRSGAVSVSEGFGEDDAFVTNSIFEAGGADLFAAQGTSFDVAASGRREADDAGLLFVTAGTSFFLDVGAETFSMVQNPGIGPWQWDQAAAWFTGHAVFHLDQVNPPPPLNPNAMPDLKFSIDIGSDAELSDPSPDGNEFLDSGDLYRWKGGFIPFPFNGAWDDVAIFAGLDEAPDPFAPIGPPNSAPTCTFIGPAQVIPQYFDLDAADCIDVDVRTLIQNASGLPIPAFSSECVWPATNLTISFDDDLGEHYVGTPLGFCTIPVASSSPIVGATHGLTAADDEILSGLVVGGATPATLGPFWGAADETGLHANLAPNPDPAEDLDDDVDALDITAVYADGTAATCAAQYFSADHEAISTFGLDPGDVYRLTPAGPALAVDDVIDLGLLDETDIDAFEFAFHDDPQFGGPSLVILFSVDDDDFLTPGDESGGLDPSMIYVSWMTGFSVPFLDAPFPDDVDGLTVFAQELPPLSLRGACCLAGVCADGFTALDCANNGGLFQGNGTTCAVVNCPQTGACCFGCAPAPAPPCPDPTGAIGAQCADLTAADCAASQGVFRGAGTSCADLPFPCQCRGDLDGDGRTNIFDFSTLAANFGGAGPACATRAQGDVNCDGVVNVFDFAIVAADFGCDSN